MPHRQEMGALALYSNGDGKRSVANVAVTCRSVHVPAMSVLWETMSGLAPLICTLPPDHVDEYEEVPENHESTTIIGVSGHRLDSNARLALKARRLDHHGRFIKHVTIHNEDAYYATLHDLSIHKVSGYRLLPEVRTLNLHLDAVGGPEGIYMLLGPQVDTIYIFAICRNLRTLKVDFDDCDEEGIDSMERLLRVISGTVRDFCSTILVDHLAVPTLRHFRNFQHLADTFSLPSLRSFEIITHCTFLGMAPFLRHLQAEHLHTLAIFPLISQNADFVIDVCILGGTFNCRYASSPIRL
ncbi:hypothetical protein POSPLADRAFT_1156800 [Postia placenta MAD-698-R-SB12]|uniref:Uncharacterized protein n=1 Tax=Postia placenta MAD-698-R-SB12 TaxID=670580 RepID=A0A1X6MM62_9APHY|nr:hypothetical protein POSPLADRAFT_1156800 [Postia placenta MAD-698-R-SB12]OSX57369.1 hypothetical protein POSPLADRAFT_1156800 [Postia placenta MAD-698-R-SB12]